jgi:glucose/arabinose dehydrogenase
MTERRSLTTLFGRRTLLAKALVGLSIALLLAAGCTSPTATPTSQPTSTPTPTAEAPDPTATPTATSAPEPTATPTVPEQLTLQVLTPADESVVSDPSVLVSGTTSPDAVLSVNGISVPVSADGTFEAGLALDIGPNVIEVVASDLTGAEESQTLAVIYIP